MSYQYKRYNQYIASLQLIDPFIQGRSPYEKIFLTTAHAYRIKPTLEAQIRQKYQSRGQRHNYPFLDYSSFSTNNEKLKQEAENLKVVSPASLLEMLENKKYSLEPQLYTRTTVGPSKRATASRMVRNYRNKKQARALQAQTQNYNRRRQASTRIQSRYRGRQVRQSPLQKLLRAGYGDKIQRIRNYPDRLQRYYNHLFNKYGPSLRAPRQGQLEGRRVRDTHRSRDNIFIVITENPKTILGRSVRTGKVIKISKLHLAYDV